jgi:hypothetical protein
MRPSALKFGFSVFAPLVFAESVLAAAKTEIGARPAAGIKLRRT